MADRGTGVRLRQAVLAAGELEPLAADLRTELALREPFRDPGVAEFGLHNVVFALGDCFLEVISPTQPGTAAGRWLERHGDGGYMLIFDLRDLGSARERAAAERVRVVWQIDLPDISGTHLHPADMGGAIVSIDRSEPYGTWRWGGPDWTGTTGAGAAARLLGVTVAVPQPQEVARRWAHVLGVGVTHEGGDTRLALDDGEVRFRSVHERAREGVCEVALAVPAELRAGRDALELGGVRFVLAEHEPGRP
jgi:hypothetical protein